MRKFLYTFLCIFLISGVKAQKKKEKQNYFASQFWLGVAEGESTTGFQFQTMHGWMHKNWFAGAGAGLDYYLFRSVPLFASGNYSLGLKKNHLLLQGDLGINIPWEDRKFMDFETVWNDFKPGLFYQGSIGFAAGVGSRRNQLMISLGYSYKQATEYRHIAVFCVNPPCPPIEEKYNYQLRRLSLRFGWHFMPN